MGWLGCTVPFESNTVVSSPEFDEDEKMLFETSRKVKVFKSFEKMGLPEDLIRGIYAYGTFSAWLACSTQCTQCAVGFCLD